MNKLEQHLIKRYVGYSTERDEYQKSEIYKSLAGAGVLTFYLLSASMIVSLIFDLYQQRASFGTVALFLIQLFNEYYVIIKLNKNKANITEIYTKEDYAREVKKLKKSAVRVFLSWTITMYGLNAYLLPLLMGEVLEFKWFVLWIWTGSGIIMGLLMYFLAKSQLKIVK